VPDGSAYHSCLTIPLNSRVTNHRPEGPVASLRILGSDLASEILEGGCPVMLFIHLEPGEGVINAEHRSVKQHHCRTAAGITAFR
jgi:hypothetical protein